ncbi:hypothetical protein [Blastococcus montanus]|uniref:hypothetical protein n=1 Tax=Blastococcus montanus TaxID=3144973 RepID=UPI003207D028
MTCDLTRILGTVPPSASKTLLWSGAGVSAEAPTNGPLGVTLTEEALDRLFLPGTREEVDAVFSSFGRSGPRLESVLGVGLQDDAHGLAGLGLLDQLAAGEPNRLHRFFARHVAVGGRHVTANFDLCIERALAAPSAAAAILHFHGRLDDPPSVRAGGSVALLQHGLSDSVAHELAGWLGAADLVVFLGYSGSDYFDVDPFFRQWVKTGAARGKTFLWVVHDEQPADPPDVVLGASCRQPQLEAFHSAGGRAMQLHARTADVLAALAKEWRLEPPEPAEPWQGYRRRSSPLGSAGARAAATTLLWDHVGSSERVLRHLPDASLPTRRSSALAAEAAWGSGRYGLARRHYRRAHAGRAVVDRVARWERIGATLWVQGRWTAAVVVLALTLRLAERRGVDPGPVPETLVRVLDHMRRSPDTRWLSMLRVARWAHEHIPDPDPRGQGVALAARFGDLRGRLDGDEERRVDEALASFTQFDSLHAVLNFVHGGIRRSAESGRVDVATVRRQVALATALGRPESLHTLVLMPGLGAYFGWRDRLSSAFALQISSWHRLRRLAAGNRPR